MTVRRRANTLSESPRNGVEASLFCGNTRGGHEPGLVRQNLHRELREAPGAGHRTTEAPPRPGAGGCGDRGNEEAQHHRVPSRPRAPRSTSANVPMVGGTTEPSP